MLYDSLIIGGGPAGLSAALALGRIRRSTLIFDSGHYRNRGVTAMHTVLSRDGTPPSQFRAIAREQMAPYTSIEFQEATIVSVQNTEVEPGYLGFKAVGSNNNTFAGRKLILATGTEDVLPDHIEGFLDNWPEHIYQCLFCDGFEQKGYPIGVLGYPHPSYNHLAMMALPFNRDDVTIYSNGAVSSDAAVQQALKTALASNVKLDTRPVKRLVNNGEGPENGITVEFETGPSAKLGMLLHRPPTRNRAQNLIDQLGLKTGEGSGEVVVDPTFAESSVKGCFVAGDSSELVKQVALAMGAGVRAAAGVSLQLCNEEGARALALAESSHL
ncbi:uncharacterized protein K452DRAFT_296965 [Aplosporella prunicola CBS 121167]|uniref:FAD/NAD(P)-binding domain-containing protein n=1 Tax=Aplosporella prunicola CBS 121167 TaxID=1176127 RepID=A0A6A6BG84_9PEZI|nr:uncharacterized protein K452DRAFT_296965 [Aplosporella prunicola CBS 121167]KAF2143180.1 hypothetical protein K452DRAFT_296965 [Aplosporella prunicola CBS 121167]